jgi:hypothetical protein
MMADISEESKWHDAVYQWSNLTREQGGDPVQGGAPSSSSPQTKIAIATWPVKQLVDRTKYLKDQLGTHTHPGSGTTGTTVGYLNKKHQFHYKTSGMKVKATTGSRFLTVYEADDIQFGKGINQGVVDGILVTMPDTTTAAEVPKTVGLPSTVYYLYLDKDSNNKYNWAITSSVPVQFAIAKVTVPGNDNTSNLANSTIEAYGEGTRGPFSFNTWSNPTIGESFSLQLPSGFKLKTKAVLLLRDSVPLLNEDPGFFKYSISQSGIDPNVYFLNATIQANLDNIDLDVVLFPGE